MYIGSAVDIKKRWWLHFKNLKLGKHHSAKLQRHYNKYGKDDLIFSVITICDKEELVPINKIIRPEQFFLWAYNPYFNNCPWAGSSLGIKRSDATKEKLSKINTGMIGPNTGKKASAETRAKQSIAKKGKPSPRKGVALSEETKQKISESKKGKFTRSPQHYIKGQESPFKGKHHTEEAKQKNREKHLGTSERCKKGVLTREKHGLMLERDKKGKFKKKTR